MTTVGQIKPSLYPVKSTLPWYQRALSRSSSYLDTSNRKWYHDITSKTIGQTIGSTVIGLSIVDFGYRMFFNIDETSFSRKYLTPLLGAILGSLGMAISRPPRDVFASDLLRTGIINTLDKLQKGLNGKDFQRLFSAEDKTRISEKVDSLVSNAKQVIIRSIQAAAAETLNPTTESSVYIPEDISLEALCLFANCTEGGQRILSGLSNVKNNPNQEVLEDLLITIREKLKPIGADMLFGYEKKDDTANVYFLSTDHFSHQSRPDLKYRPFIRISTKPVCLYLALDRLNKCLSKIEEEPLSLQPNTSDSEETLSKLNQKMLSAFGEFFRKINIGAIRGGYFEITKTNAKQAPVLIDERLENLLPTSKIEQVLRWVQRNSSTIELDKTSLLGDPSDTQSLRPEGHREKVTVKAKSKGKLADSVSTLDQTTDEAQESHSGAATDALSEANEKAKFETLDDILREHLFFNFNEKDSKDVTLLKYCLVKAWMFTNPPDDKDFEKYIGIKRELKTRIERLSFLKEAEELNIEKTRNGSVIPNDLLKLDYFLETIGIPKDTKSLEIKKRDKILRLLNLLHPKQKEKIEVELLGRSLPISKLK